jgi:hypothetical protein
MVLLLYERRVIFWFANINLLQEKLDEHGQGKFSIVQPIPRFAFELVVRDYPSISHVKRRKACAKRPAPRSPHQASSLT